MSLRRTANGKAPARREDIPVSEKLNDTVKTPPVRPSKVPISHIGPALVDFHTAFTMVFGGCCFNVLAYEQLLIMNPRIGSALTFSQMMFITLQALPSFLTFPPSSFLPRLKPRQVPLSRWALHVLVLITGSLLNNWAFAYNVPLTVLIIFRSAGLPVSMLFGYLFSRKRYSVVQIASTGIVTAGVILATLTRKSPPGGGGAQSAEDLTKYFVGIGMIVVSLLCTALLGVLQEGTYGKYGPCWREGVFYTHCLSLPVFLFLGSDIKQGITSLADPRTSSGIQAAMILIGNLVAQLICVSGVNRLSSQMSSVSTNIVLTARKALSLCFSVWWFGNPWNAQLGAGAFMVFLGSLLYSLNAENINKND